MRRTEHVLWSGRPKVTVGHGNEFDKPKGRYIVLTTESLLMYPEDSPAQAIAQAIKTQQPPDSRPTPIMEVRLAGIRGFCCLGDPVTHIAAAAEDSTHVLAGKLKVIVLLNASAVVSATPSTAAAGSSEQPAAAVSHNTLWSLCMAEPNDMAVFSMCLSQMARKVNIITRGVLQKKGTLLLWKHRFYYLLDSFDLVQCNTASPDSPINLHIPLWSESVTWAAMSSVEAPTGCHGIVLRFRDSDVGGGVPASAAASSAAMRSILLACERDDATAWLTVWDPAFAKATIKNSADDILQIEAVTVLRSVLAANKSRYRILIRSDRLTDAVRRGIPLELRGEFWCVLCNVDGRKALKSTSEASAGKSLYAKLVQEASNRGSLFQLSFRATQASALSQGGSPAMTRLLLAYSAWTQTSQGNALAPTACGTSSATVYHPAMGGIASSLLTQLPEENAFWALTWISDRLMPQYFSTNHCIGLQVYSSVFGEMLAHFLPATAAAFTAHGLLPHQLGQLWLPHCFANMNSDVTARLWDLTMLNGHGMLFRLSMAILSCITVSELGTLDTLCATEESTFQHIVQEARSLSVEVIISAAFTNPSFSDIERDFTSRRDELCIQVLREVDTLLKLCQSRQDSVACVKQTALEFREVLGRFSAELPSIPIPDGALNGFVTATTASDVALAANPLSASLRARAHVCSLEESLLHLDKMCDQLHAAIQCRRILLQRVVQVNVTISKAALAVQSHLMSRQEMEGLGETIAGSDVAAVSGDIPVGPTAAQVVDPQWLDDAAVALLDQHPTDSDSPELLLTATIAAIWGLSSFGFGLLSVAKEVDDELGSFGFRVEDPGPHSLLSRLCMAAVADVHDFAFKLCGLTSSVQDSHVLHRFEARPVLPILTPSKALQAFQGTFTKYTDEVCGIQEIVDRLEKQFTPPK